MNTTTQEIDMTTKALAPRTVIYGAAAYGGKIHRTHAGGHAYCLSSNGYKPMRSIIASITHASDSDYAAHRAAEVAALRAAKINPNNLCQKCCSGVAKTMKEAAA